MSYNEKSLVATLNSAKATKNPSIQIKQLLPVQTVDHVSHSVDEIIVFLRVADDDAMEPLHVGVNGFKSGRLSTTCRTTSM